MSELTKPTPGRVFRLTYSNARPDDEPQLYKDRDSLAFCELNAALLEQGYRYGTTIYLYPDDERKLAEFPRFEPSDILVMTTRPPLHDQDGFIPPRRKVIRRARTELEVVLFEELAKYFGYLTRKHMELTDHAFRSLQTEDRRMWQHVELYEYLIPGKTHSASEVQKHYVGPETVSPGPSRHSAVAFFVGLNPVPRINCAFVASFGMDALGTLIWNRLIRTRFADWLASPRFVMAELVYKKTVVGIRPITPEFIDDGDFVDVRMLT